MRRTIALCATILAVTSPSANAATLGEALNAPDLAWTTSGAERWIAQSETTHDGQWAAEGWGGPWRHETWLETTITGPGTLLFWWRIFAEDSAYLRYDTNAVPVAAISGFADWQRYEQTLGPGDHTLRWWFTPDRWDYEKAWVDEVIFLPSTGPAVIVAQPESRTADPGTTVLLSVAAGGAPPLSYQWRCNGTNLVEGGRINGTTVAALALANVQFTDAGGYSVVVGNAHGSVTSTVATLAVPFPPIPLGQWPGFARGNALRAVVTNGLAYIAAGQGGLIVADMNDPAHPVRLGSCSTEYSAVDLSVVGTLVYIADADRGLQVIDASDPAKPRRLGGYDTSGSAEGVQVVGTLAYVADVLAGLQVIDVSNPANPVRLGGYDTPGNAEGLHVVGNLAYIADGTAGLQVIDVSNPADPVWTRPLRGPSAPTPPRITPGACRL
jgi:hypothetical protein